jgi:hypothetical protein
MVKNHHLAEARAVTISLVEMFALSAKCFSKGPNFQNDRSVGVIIIKRLKTDRLRPRLRCDFPDRLLV